MTSINKIVKGTLVRLDRSSNVPGALSAVKLMANYVATYGSSIGIVLQDHSNHAYVLFPNGDQKYIHKTFLENVGDKQ
jgi:hypothetical protein